MKPLTPEQTKGIMDWAKENLDYTNPEGFHRKLEDFLNANTEPECICCGRVEDGIVTPNPDCPIHGGLHGNNPYKDEQFKSSDGRVAVANISAKGR